MVAVAVSPISPTHRIQDAEMLTHVAKEKCLAISAVNFTEGGPLTVLREFVQAASEVLEADWSIVVFVHDRQLIAPAANVIAIEIPYTKRSWLRRLWFEFYQLRGFAKTLRPSLWVSLHDITPNVGVSRQAVYCHNPAPFYKLRFRDAYFDPILLAFRIAYSWVYRLNINKNRVVIVQQEWLRTEFEKWTNAQVEIVVAHPSVASLKFVKGQRRERYRNLIFLYPALPRVFKNMELLCRAARRLELNSAWSSQIILTIDGSENRYARWLRRQFADLRSVKFIGLQTEDQMVEQYRNADCLLFPSRLETWGLPITEAKERGLPMFVADLPYARQSVGNYDQAEFIDIDSHDSLADKLLQFQDGKFEFRVSTESIPAAPFVAGWSELVSFITKDAESKKS
jgi:glycosyltransferase involved in cell wall biosynthesis